VWRLQQCERHERTPAPSVEEPVTDMPTHMSMPMVSAGVSTG
jgi:hypothetical protein